MNFSNADSSTILGRRKICHEDIPYLTVAAPLQKFREFDWIARWRHRISTIPNQKYYAARFPFPLVGKLFGKSRCRGENSGDLFAGIFRFSDVSDVTSRFAYSRRVFRENHCRKIPLGLQIIEFRIRVLFPELGNRGGGGRIRGDGLPLAGLEFPVCFSVELTGEELRWSGRTRCIRNGE